MPSSRRAVVLCLLASATAVGGCYAGDDTVYENLANLRAGSGGGGKAGAAGRAGASGGSAVGGGAAGLSGAGGTSGAAGSVGGAAGASGVAGVAGAGAASGAAAAPFGGTGGAGGSAGTAGMPGGGASGGSAGISGAAGAAGSATAGQGGAAGSGSGAGMGGDFGGAGKAGSGGSFGSSGGGAGGSAGAATGSGYLQACATLEADLLACKTPPSDAAKQRARCVASQACAQTLYIDDAPATVLGCFKASCAVPIVLPSTNACVNDAASDFSAQQREIFRKDAIKKSQQCDLLGSMKAAASLKKMSEAHPFYRAAIYASFTACLDKGCPTAVECLKATLAGACGGADATNGWVWPTDAVITDDL